MAAIEGIATNHTIALGVFKFMFACVILSKEHLEVLPSAFFIKNKLRLKANNRIWLYRAVNSTCLFIYLLTHSLTPTMIIYTNTISYVD